MRKIWNKREERVNLFQAVCCEHEWRLFFGHKRNRINMLLWREVALRSSSNYDKRSTIGRLILLQHFDSIALNITTECILQQGGGGGGNLNPTNSRDLRLSFLAPTQIFPRHVSKKQDSATDNKDRIVSHLKPIYARDLDNDRKLFRR